MKEENHFSVIPLFPSPLISLIDETLCEDVEKLFLECDKNWLVNSQNNNLRTKDVHVLNLNGKLLLSLTEISKELISSVLKISNQIQITTSWFTKVPSNEKGTPHTHTNSWWSGVYYFRDSMSAIKFEKFPFGIDVVSKTSEQNEFNSLAFYAVPKKGTLLLFPSELIHSIQKNDTEFDRCTLAFNIMPKGLIENGDSTFTF